jgi:hypothetical protein
MYATSQNRRMTMYILMWLITVAISSGTLDYSQFCYSSGDTTFYLKQCRGYYDRECFRYGENVYCEEQKCEVTPCPAGYFRQCKLIYFLCVGMTSCGTSTCV